MLVTRARTERPHGALLQFDTGIRHGMYRIGGRLRRYDVSCTGVAVGIPPLCTGFLTSCHELVMGQCLGGEFTGVVHLYYSGQNANGFSQL